MFRGIEQRLEGVLVIVPDKDERESLVGYAERLSELYRTAQQIRERKPKGQFFTPAQVSEHMAALFKIQRERIRLVDPGAGTGILTAAFCERILECSDTKVLSILVHENDSLLDPYLTKVLEACQSELEMRGHTVEYRSSGEDFVLENSCYLRSQSLLNEDEGLLLHDFVICNPPYYKLSKNSPQATAMPELISGQPNIYTFFMAVSAGMLAPGGEMVFITPRSFCSGPYYRRVRDWLLDSVRLNSIHVFGSRREVFGRDNVLQENVIIWAEKPLKPREESKKRRINITSTEDTNFKKRREIEAQYTDVIFKKGGQISIRIPTSRFDIEILNVVDSWPRTLEELGMQISTGPVVPFRAKQYLLPGPVEEPEFAPLLWMQNMKGTQVVWPLENSKPSVIRICKETSHLLLPVKNYVLVKRFTSKEQKRRLQASVLLESEFPYDFVGVENHVNYIHGTQESLSVYEAFGLASILNTSIVDNYFRSLSGNTQVNATDVRRLPLPAIEEIRRIGKSVLERDTCADEYDVDRTVKEILEIVVGETKNEQGR